MDRQLRAFLAVAETSNLTLAADRLGLTQPALTKRLASLEDEIGVPLFLRHRRGMDLTAAGRIYLRHARRMEQEDRQAREEIGLLSDAGIETLRIGAGPLFHSRFIAPAFAALRRRFPLLRLDLVARNNSLTLPLLTAGQLDLVLGTLEPVAAESMLLVEPLLEVEQAVALRADLVPEGRERLAPADLPALEWVGYSKAADSREVLTRYFARHLIGVPRVVAQTSSFATGLDLVRHAGFAMQVPLQVGEAEGIRVLPVDPPLNSALAGVYLRESSQGVPAVMALIEELRRITAG